MRRMARTTVRLIASAVAVSAFAVVLSLPATAYAHTSTKLTVAYSAIVDNSVPGTTPAAPTVTAKLYRRAPGKWVALSRRIILYFVDPITGHLSFVTAKTGSKVTFTLPKRGAYQLLYVGSATYRAARGYTMRQERVGAIATNPRITMTAVDGTYSLVDVAYDVSWNTEAFAGPVLFAFGGVFTTDPQRVAPEMSTSSGYTLVMREIDAPETLVFSYRVRTASAIGSLLALSMVGPSGDRFVIGEPQNNTPFVLER